MSKINRNSIFAFALLPLLCSGQVYAYHCDAGHDFIHCAYMSGLSQAKNDGRYIRVNFNSQSQPPNFTHCYGGNTVLFSPQQSGELILGVNTDHFFICQDSQGTQCEPIGTDTYIVSKKGKTYFSEPSTYAINVKAVKYKYPACTVDF